MTIKSLKDIFIHELKDAVSANDQMLAALPAFAEKAQDPKLKEKLQETIDGIPDNTAKVKAILKRHDESPDGVHCKGMQGLVAEAKKHALEEDIPDKDVRDVVILAQYQRMTHYGITGFGTAKAFAAALGDTESKETLDELTASMYRSDEFMTDLAERSVNLQAKAG